MSVSKPIDLSLYQKKWVVLRDCAQVRGSAVGKSYTEIENCEFFPAAFGEEATAVAVRATGYIALYRFDIQRHQLRGLALRHQREVGYLP
jgi:hypothetical protein